MEQEISPLNNICGLNDKTIDRFLSKFKVGTPDECWDWKGTITCLGYGSFNLMFRPIAAHRLSYQLSIGPIPEKRQIHHKCKNTICINPHHLMIVTSDEHHKIHRNKTHCKRGHEFTESSTGLYKGVRYCKICRSWRKSKGRWESPNGPPPKFSSLYCKRGHPLFGDNIYLFKNWNNTFGRRCKTCNTEISKKYAQKNREALLERKLKIRERERQERIAERAEKIRNLETKYLTDQEIVEIVREIISETATP